MFFMAICDDDKIFLNSMLAYLGKRYKNEIIFMTYTSCTDLLYAIEFKDLFFECILMDIKFDDGDGIEIIKKIQQLSPQTKVIYITGYIENSTRIFETKPSNFLVKPVDYSKIVDAIEKMKQEIYTKERDCVVIHTIDRTCITVALKNIIYIESNKRKLIMHTDSGTYIFYGTLNEFEQKIMSKEEQCFIRCHQSYLLNMQYITGKNGTVFILTTGEKLPISRARYEDVKEKYMDFMGMSLWD